MDDFQITGFNVVKSDSEDRPNFMVVNYQIRMAGDIDGTAHNIEGKVRISPNWPATHADLEKIATAEIKRVLGKAATMI